MGCGFIGAPERASDTQNLNAISDDIAALSMTRSDVMHAADPMAHTVLPAALPIAAGLIGATHRTAVPTERTALLAQTGRALGAAEMFLAAARARLVVRVAPEGSVEPERFATEQLAAHALAWMASYVEALRQMRNWAVRLDEGGKFGEIEALILEIAYGEYLAQLAGGIPMAQGEFARPQDLGLDDGEIAPLRAGAAGSLSAGASAARLQLGARLAESRRGRVRAISASTIRPSR